MAPTALWQLNNNPGNLRYVGQNGAAPGAGGFAAFNSPQAGVQALDGQLARYLMRGKNTPRSIISTYAPSSENDTDGYIQQASKETGIAPDQQVSAADLPRLRNAIIRRETGQDPTTIIGNDASMPPQQGETVNVTAPGATQADADRMNANARAGTPADVQTTDAAPIEQEPDDLGLRIARWAARMGAGAAQNGPWAASLGAGASEATKGQEEDENRRIRVAQMNQQSAAQNARNRIDAAQVNTQSREYQLRKFNQASELARTTGMSIDRAIAAVSANATPADVSAFRRQAAFNNTLNQQKVEKANAPRTYAGTTFTSRKDGHWESGLLTTDNRGNVRFRVGDQTYDTIPQGFAPHTDSGQRDFVRQQTLAEAAMAQEQQGLNQTDERTKAMEDVLPDATPGSTLTAEMARRINSVFGGDANSATQILDKDLSARAVEQIGRYGNRPDAAAQTAALKSSPDISRDPVLSAMVIRQDREHVNNRRAAYDAWQDYKTSNPDTTYLPHEFMAKYSRDHPEHVVTMDEAKAWLADAKARKAAARQQQSAAGSSTPANVRDYLDKNVRQIAPGVTLEP